MISACRHQTMNPFPADFVSRILYLERARVFDIWPQKSMGCSPYALSSREKVRPEHSPRATEKRTIAFSAIDKVRPARVAQVSNLPYRRFPIGRTSESSGA